MMSGRDTRTVESARELAAGMGLTVGAALLKPVRVRTLREALAPQDQPPAPVTAAELSAGIANGELHLEYQPIVTCASGELVCLEALVRWSRPGIGRVMPAAFIPLAEADSELMDALTLSVAARAAADWAVLQQGGFTGRIGLNISAQNLRRLDFPERLDAALATHGLPPDRVKLEVTETAAMSDPLVQVDVLLRLNLRGFELVIDDFGTGYSSLSMLRRLPYSELKIDRSFVKDMLASRDCMAVVKAALALAQTMGLRTVAEGVEDAAALETLRLMGVTFAQGFGIGKPMAPARVADWIAAQRPEPDASAKLARFGAEVAGGGRAVALGQPRWRH